MEPTIILKHSHGQLDAFKREEYMPFADRTSRPLQSILNMDHCITYLRVTTTEYADGKLLQYAIEPCLVPVHKGRSKLD